MTLPKSSAEPLAGRPDSSLPSLESLKHTEGAEDDKAAPHKHKQIGNETDNPQDRNAFHTDSR